MQLAEFTAAVESCIDATEHALALAEQGQWHELDAAMNARLYKVRETFSVDFPDGSEALIRQSIERIQLLDDQIERLAVTAKANIGEQMKEYNTSQKAINAYRPK